MKKLIISLMLALAVIMPTAVSAPAHAGVKRVCETHRGQWDEADFCFKIKWVRVAGWGGSDLKIVRSVLWMRSPLYDSDLGFLDFHNIDLRVREGPSGDRIHTHLNGQSGSRRWIDYHDYMCVPNLCRAQIRYTIGWGGLFGWPDHRDDISFPFGRGR